MTQRFVLPRFYPILDTGAVAARGGDVRAVAEILLNCGVRILQYRHKNRWTQSEYDQAAKIAELCNSSGTQFVVNDRADYACLLKAGLHVGQDDLPVKAARMVIGNQAMVGLSTHNPRQLKWAAGEAIDYVALGPIFPTSSKLRPDPVIGIDKLKTMRALVDKPLVAIGGITLTEALNVLAAGADSLAVVTAFLPDQLSSAALERNLKSWVAL